MKIKRTHDVSVAVKHRTRYRKVSSLLLLTVLRPIHVHVQYMKCVLVIHAFCVMFLALLSKTRTSSSKKFSLLNIIGSIV